MNYRGETEECEEGKLKKVFFIYIDHSRLERSIVVLVVYTLV